MMILLLNLLVFVVWLATSRQLYRTWIRRDTLARTDLTVDCSHGYQKMHVGRPCHKKIPAPPVIVATLAMVASLFLPITLIYLAVMYKTPVSPTRQAEIITELTRQNEMLRKINELP